MNQKIQSPFTINMLVLECTHFDNIHPKLGIPAIFDPITRQLTAQIDAERYLATTAENFGAAWDLDTCYLIEPVPTRQIFTKAVKTQYRISSHNIMTADDYQCYELFFKDGHKMLVAAPKTKAGDIAPPTAKNGPSLLRIAQGDQLSRLQHKLMFMHMHNQIKKIVFLTNITLGAGVGLAMAIGMYYVLSASGVMFDATHMDAVKRLLAPAVIVFAIMAFIWHKISMLDFITKIPPVSNMIERSWEHHLAKTLHNHHNNTHICDTLFTQHSKQTILKKEI